MVSLSTPLQEATKPLICKVERGQDGSKGGKLLRWYEKELMCVCKFPLCKSNGILLFFQLQLYGFNAELYSNLSDAQQKPNGVAAISIMIRVSVRVCTAACYYHYYYHCCRIIIMMDQKCYFIVAYFQSFNNYLWLCLLRNFFGRVHKCQCHSLSGSQLEDLKRNPDWRQEIFSVTRLKS